MQFPKMRFLKCSFLECSYQQSDHHTCHQQNADDCCDDPCTFLSLLAEINHDPIPP